MQNCIMSSVGRHRHRMDILVVNN